MSEHVLTTEDKRGRVKVEVDPRGDGAVKIGFNRLDLQRYEGVTLSRESVKWLANILTNYAERELQSDCIPSVPKWRDPSSLRALTRDKQEAKAAAKEILDSYEDNPENNDFAAFRDFKFNKKLAKRVRKKGTMLPKVVDILEELDGVWRSNNSGFTFKFPSGTMVQWYPQSSSCHFTGRGGTTSSESDGKIFKMLRIAAKGR